MQDLNEIPDSLNLKEFDGFIFIGNKGNKIFGYGAGNKTEVIEIIKQVIGRDEFILEILAKAILNNNNVDIVKVPENVYNKFKDN